MSDPDPPIRTCVTCGYDLAGLPTPMCPECGCDTIEAARLRVLRRASRFRISRHFLLVPAGFVFWLACLVAPISRGFVSTEFCISLAICVPLVFRWLWHGRHETNPVNPAFLLFVGPLLGSFFIWWWCQPPNGQAASWQFYVSMHVGLLTLTLVGWTMVPKCSLWNVVFTAGWLCLQGAVYAFAQAQWHLLHGHAWSIFDSFIMRRFQSQYPLRNDEVVRMTRAYVVLGAAMMASAFFIRRAKRERR